MFYQIPEDFENKKKNKKESIEEQILKIKLLVDKYLTPKAKQRLKFVELAHPEKALQAYLFIFQLIQTGRINKKIDEDLLKKILQKIAEQTSPKFRIKFK